MTTQGATDARNQHGHTLDKMEVVNGGDVVTHAVDCGPCLKGEAPPRMDIGLGKPQSHVTPEPDGRWRTWDAI